MEEEKSNTGSGASAWGVGIVLAIILWATGLGDDFGRAINGALGGLWASVQRIAGDERGVEQQPGLPDGITADLTCDRETGTAQLEVQNHRDSPASLAFSVGAYTAEGDGRTVKLTDEWLSFELPPGVRQVQDVYFPEIDTFDGDCVIESASE